MSKYKAGEGDGDKDEDSDLFRESDEDFWNTSQTGHDFEDSDASISFNPISTSTPASTKPYRSNLSDSELSRSYVSDSERSSSYTSDSEPSRSYVSYYEPKRVSGPAFTIFKDPSTVIDTSSVSDQSPVKDTSTASVSRPPFTIYKDPSIVIDPSSVKDSSTASLSSFEEPKEEAILDVNLNMSAIRPKVKFEEIGHVSGFLTIRSMLFGKECDLSVFKTLIDKQKILDAACSFHDGNTILKVVMFLRNTLKKSLFQREIKQYPAATNMYLSYLREGQHTNELEDMLLFLQRPVDLALLKYENANMIQDPKRKLNVLVNLRNTYCESGTLKRFIISSVDEHCMCMEDYKVLMDHKVVSNLCDEKVFEAVIGRKEISDSCAIDTLVFSLLHFYNVAEIASISAWTLRTRYGIKDMKYHWCILSTLAAAQSYDNLEKMFLIKKFFGGTKIQSYVPYKTFLDVLYRSNPPLEVMERFVAAADSADKLALAKKYHCNSIVIDILKKNRSRSALIEFQNSLSPNSTDYQNISASLNSSDVKWKP